MELVWLDGMDMQEKGGQGAQTTWVAQMDLTAISWVQHYSQVEDMWTGKVMDDRKPRLWTETQDLYYLPSRVRDARNSDKRIKIPFLLMINCLVFS